MKILNENRNIVRIILKNIISAKNAQIITKLQSINKNWIFIISGLFTGSNFGVKNTLSIVITIDFWIFCTLTYLFAFSDVHNWNRINFTMCGNNKCFIKIFEKHHIFLPLELSFTFYKINHFRFFIFIWYFS